MLSSDTSDSPKSKAKVMAKHILFLKEGYWNKHHATTLNRTRLTDMHRFGVISKIGT